MHVKEYEWCCRPQKCEGSVALQTEIRDISQTRWKQNQHKNLKKNKLNTLSVEDLKLQKKNNTVPSYFHITLM